MRGEVEDFLEMQKALKVPDATIITLRSYLRDFIKFCQDYELQEPQFITSEHLRLYQQFLPNKTGRDFLPIKATVLNLHIWAAKKFLEYLYEDRQIEAPLHHLLKRAKQPTILPKRVMRHEQVLLLLEQQDLSNSIEYRDHVILTFMY